MSLDVPGCHRTAAAVMSVARTLFVLLLASGCGDEDRYPERCIQIAKAICARISGACWDGDGCVRELLTAATCADADRLAHAEWFKPCMNAAVNASCVSRDAFTMDWDACEGVFELRE